MPTPVSPDDIRQRQDLTEYFVWKAVEYINMILVTDASVAVLHQGKGVEIYDSDNSSEWQAGHEGAVKLFKDAGWRVATVIDQPDTYLFYLPMERFNARPDVNPR